MTECFVKKICQLKYNNKLRKNVLPAQQICKKNHCLLNILEFLHNQIRSFSFVFKVFFKAVELQNFLEPFPELIAVKSV